MASAASDHPGRRRRPFLAALVLMGLLVATVHLAAAHDLLKCPCGVPHAHPGLSLQHAWSRPGPPPPSATPAPPGTSHSLHLREPSPFRPLRAPPASSHQSFLPPA